MKTRWMIKVESKIKDAPRGAPFILFSCALVPVMYWLKWNVKWTVTRSEWSLNSSTLRLIFWVYSKTQAVSRDIPLLLINTNNPHDLFSTWMIDTYELEHHSRLVQHMAESWIPWMVDSAHGGWVLDCFPNHLTSDLLDFSSMDYCYNANNCFDRSNNWVIHFDCCHTQLLWLQLTITAKRCPFLRKLIDVLTLFKTTISRSPSSRPS